MNCKEGDLAYVVGSCATPGLKGRFVIVVRLHAAHDVFVSVGVGGPRFTLEHPAPCWVCKPADGTTLPWLDLGTWKTFDFEERPIDDAGLRPIRDSDGEDEMLRIVGKPEPHGVAE